MSEVVTVAVDGPAASGKSTLARRLAVATGLRFLDTGLLYRAVARRLLERGEEPADAVAAERAAMAVEPRDLDALALAGERIGAVASAAAVHPGVRRALLDLQRRFAAEPPGAVLAGRDIGSVVLPDATLKLFITASPEERARRRFEELRGRGEGPIYERVLQDVVERDRRDRERPVAPLVVTPDAVLIDTSALDIDASLEALRKAFDARCGTISGKALLQP